MPKEVLHLLYETHEAQAFHQGVPVHIITHGIEHVVIQLEKRKYQQQHGAVQLNSEGTPALPPPQPRPKTASCRHCHQRFAAQGKWKHEKYCRQHKRKDQKHA